MLNQIAAMPKESFVILNNWGSSKREPKEPFFAIFSKLTDANPNPVLLARENRFEVGVVGGFFVPGKQHGGETAALAARILNGENPDAIKVKPAGILPIFDYESTSSRRAPFSPGCRRPSRRSTEPNWQWPAPCPARCSSSCC